MALARGPFTVDWNGAVLNGIEEMNVEYEVAQQDYESVQGTTYTVFGNHKASAEITFLETDVPSLAEALPQYFKANGSTLSNGQVVADAQGALDIVPGGCTVSDIVSDLNITSCGNPGHVVRLHDVKTEIAGIEFDGPLRKVRVAFIGVPSGSEATAQFFRSGKLTGVS